MNSTASRGFKGPKQDLQPFNGQPPSEAPKPQRAVRAAPEAKPEKAGAIVVMTTEPPAARPRKAGRWAPVHEAAKSLKPGSWFEVPGTREMDNAERWRVVERLRAWAYRHGLAVVAYIADGEPVVILKGVAR